MLTVSDLSVRFGSATALDDVSITVGRGEIVAVLGPSGSGKTTLLRSIAGLEPLVAGRVEWDGRDLTEVAAHRREFGLMFQDHALFSHHDVQGNVAFGLRMHARGHSRTEIAARCHEMLELVGLTGYDHRRVDQLSGGEQQRVALARALAPSPRLLMLDEPLASVDRERREHLAVELQGIIHSTKTATLLVTHDLDEAFTLADSIVVLDRGRVMQSGPAGDAWRAPTSVTVARFLGVATELQVPTTHGRAQTPWGEVPAPGLDKVWLGFRPADIRVDPRGRVTGTILATWFRRDHYLVQLDTPLGRITAMSPQRIAIGDRVSITADLSSAIVLPASHPDGRAESES